LAVGLHVPQVVTDAVSADWLHQ